MDMHDRLKSIDAPVKAPRPAALDEASKGRLYRQYLQGVAVEVLAKQSGRSVAAVARAVNELRAERLAEQKIEAMPHPSFDDPKAAAEILAPLPAPADAKAGRKVKPPEGVPPYLASLYDVPLLWPGSRRRTCSAR